MNLALMTALLIGIHNSLAMRVEDANPGSLVRFHFSDRSRRKQKNESLIRRAEALDGQIAMIMERPFYFDNTRTRIQSLEDPDLTLAVKLKHLEFIRAPPTAEEIDIEELPPLESSAEEHSDEEMSLTVHRPVFGDSGNDYEESDHPKPSRETIEDNDNEETQEYSNREEQEIQIELCVERKDAASTGIDHQLTHEYLQKELSIADDLQYRAVLACHPNTTQLTRIKSNRMNTNLHQSHLGLQLLETMKNGIVKDECWATMAMMTSSSRARLLTAGKNLLSQCLWVIAQREHFESSGFLITLGFFQTLCVAESRSAHFTRSFIKSLRQHFLF